MNEQFSALIDNQLALDEAEHVLSTLRTNGNAANAWQHYHLIGDAMRGSTALSANFTQHLMQKIEQEPTVLSPNAALINTSSTAKIVKHQLPTAWAMAASVAGVMAVGWVFLQTQSMNQTDNMQIAKNSAVVNTATTQTQVALNQIPAVQINKAQAYVEPTIPNEYLVAHQATVPSTSAYYIQTASYSK
ncbi:MAG: sigma-E factor negative regulatory protein [Methylophilaceae bacterium]